MVFRSEPLSPLAAASGRASMSEKSLEVDAVHQLPQLQLKVHTRNGREPKKLPPYPRQFPIALGFSVSAFSDRPAAGRAVSFHTFQLSSETVHDGSKHGKDTGP